jgi:hypothetical protein
MSGTSKVPEILLRKFIAKTQNGLSNPKIYPSKNQIHQDPPIQKSNNLCVSDEKQCSRRQQTAGPSVSELRIVAPGRPN